MVAVVMDDDDDDDDSDDAVYSYILYLYKLHYIIIPL